MMFKIVKISANFPPRRCGVADYTRILCEHLVNLKEDISFYIITSADPKIIESGYSYERIKVLPVINNWSWSCLSKIKEIIKEISPDIVHIEHNRSLYGCLAAMNFLPYLLKKENPKHKIIITFHDLPGPWKNKDPFFWLTNFSNLIYCDRFLVSSDNDFNNFACRLPFIKRKCMLLPVGSNMPKVENNRTMIRKELNIAEDILALGYFGFIREDKCLTELFYAFSELLKSGLNLKLLMIGGILNEEMFLSLQKLSYKLNINEMIIWKDYQAHEKVSELLSALDIVVLPYKNGIGTNSGIFAACVQHNLPIVTTKAKFMPEIIKDNYNLIVVEPNNLKELTNALFRITQDLDLRKKLTQNLKELNDYLSWQNISQKILKLYITAI